MGTVVLGRTGILSPKNAFGALPIQRLSREEAVRLLRRARDGGFTYFDTARGYSDSEEKLGEAFGAQRQEIHLATKTMAANAAQFWEDLHRSLRFLCTDYIDVYQFHNPAFVPRPGGADGLYDAAIQARAEGKIRFIGLTSHRFAVAEEAVLSGLYDLLQYPLCYLSSAQDQTLIPLCEERGVGLVAMKALSGGLIRDASCAFAWANQWENLLPIWGIQRESELEQFLSFARREPLLTPVRAKVIEKDRAELAGDFCRACGYCQPCPQGIDISTVARMALLLRRFPLEPLLSASGQEKVARAETCIDCGQCASRCPYGLDTPALIRRNVQAYRAFQKENP